jgi:hypothetical protein
VRLYLAKTLKSLYLDKLINSNVLEMHVKGALEMLQKDLDSDVIYYSQECLILIEEDNKMKD